jgi:hypothetical protein
MNIHCPSGLVFSARSWKLGDHAELIKARDRSMTQLPKIMAALASDAVIDPGPYTAFKEGEKVDWDAVSHADITVANILIRAGREPKLIAEFICAVCRQLPRDPQEIDLLDLPIYMASEEGRMHLHDGNPVVREVGTARVKLRALLGKDLDVLSRLQVKEPENMLEVQTCMSIAEVNAPGLKKPLTTLVEIRKFWREQEWSFRNEIDEAIDSLWGGADLAIRFTCDHLECRAQQEQSLPLGLSFYGLDDPSRHAKRAKSSAVRSVRELMQQASSPSSQDSPESPGST